MVDESGYKLPVIQKLIEFFEKKGKIKYSQKTNELAVRNFIKYNPQGSPKVKAFVTKELENVKDRLLIPYVYAIDTVSQEEQEEEKEKKEEQEQTGDAVVWPTFEDFWQKYGKNVDRAKCEKKFKKIQQRAREDIMHHLELYIPSTPDEQYRKNPYTYLSNESWKNQIIIPTANGKQRITAQGTVNRLNSYSD